MVQQVTQAGCQHSCLVMLRVTRVIQQGEGACARHVQQLLHRLGTGLQFRDIAFLKSVPSRRGVPEPLAQSGAGGDIPQSWRQVCALFADPTGPQPVHQHATAIIGFGRVINAPDADGVRHGYPASVESAAEPKNSYRI